ncbi:MAG: helix-turn-helix domain-containing protein [Stackebrandtia sp.]
MNDAYEPTRIRLDARNLRGMAHPARVRILGKLRSEGPSTATSLARRLGMNSGATSYHLRQLAEYGFVVEDSERGTKRERWWKAAHWSTAFSERELAEDDSGLGQVFWRSVAQAYADATARAVDELPTLPEEWKSAHELSDFLLQLTPEEAKRLSAEIHAVVKRYRTADPQAGQAAPEGAVQVSFQFQLFPRAEKLSSRNGSSEDRP